MLERWLVGVLLEEEELAFSVKVTAALKNLDSGMLRSRSYWKDQRYGAT